MLSSDKNPPNDIRFAGHFLGGEKSTKGSILKKRLKNGRNFPFFLTTLLIFKGIKNFRVTVFSPFFYCLTEIHSPLSSIRPLLSRCWRMRMTSCWKLLQPHRLDLSATNTRIKHSQVKNDANAALS